MKINGYRFNFSTILYLLIFLFALAGKEEELIYQGNEPE